jgi:hypothetical protein
MPFSVIEYSEKEGLDWQAMGVGLDDVEPATARDSERDVEMALVEAWEEHLEENLSFPFEAEVSEWQDRGPLRTGDRVKVKSIFEADDHYSILVEVRRRSYHNMKIRMKPPSAQQLIKEIEAHLPLPVHVTPEVSRSLREQGKDVSADEELQVSSVYDSGEMGGIVCAIEIEDQKEVLAISLTHLRIGADHPLRAKIMAYQKARVRKLMQQRW